MKLVFILFYFIFSVNLANADALFEAVEGGDVNYRNRDVNYRNHYGVTPLIGAFQNNELNKIENILLKAGVDPDLYYLGVRPLLLHAIGVQSEKGVSRIIRIIEKSLKHEAEVCEEPEEPEEPLSKVLENTYGAYDSKYSIH